MREASRSCCAWDGIQRCRVPNAGGDEVMELIVVAGCQARRHYTTAGNTISIPPQSRQTLSNLLYQARFTHQGSSMLRKEPCIGLNVFRFP